MVAKIAKDRQCFLLILSWIARFVNSFIFAIHQIITKVMKLIKILAGEWKSGNDIALLLIRIIFAIILIHGHGWGR